MLSVKNNYYIAETAFHHEGDVNFLKKLVVDILDLDIHAIKFHLLFEPEDYMVSNHSAIDVIKKICIPEHAWKEVFQLVTNANKEIVALTNDLASLKYILSVQDEYPISAIEIHSTGLNDIFLLQEICQFKKTIILGIGGSTFDEIQFAVDYLKSQGKEDILLMHGFQNYPTNYTDINFSRIPLIQQAFNLPVGYADHTDPNDALNKVISVFPIPYGVQVFEKHITNVFGEKRIDCQAAISLEMMKELIILGDDLRNTQGEDPFKMSQAELNYGNTGPMKKAIVAKHAIKKGHALTITDIAYKRTDVSSMLQQKDIFKLIGSLANQDISENELLTFENVKYEFRSANFDQFYVK